MARGLAVTKLRLLATTGDLMGTCAIGHLGDYTRLEPPGKLVGVARHLDSGFEQGPKPFLPLKPEQDVRLRLPSGNDEIERLCHCIRGSIAQSVMAP